MSWADFIAWLISLFNKPTPRPTPVPTPTPSNFTEQLLNLHNAHRKQIGVPALALNAILNSTAQKHSNWMFQNKNLDHNENGVSPGQRITAAGYKWRAYGENIAYGYTTPDAVFAGWMSSAGHKQNIESSLYKDAGFGFNGNYWTADFAKPA